MRRISPLLLIASALVLTLFGVWDLLHVKRLLEVNLNDFGRFYYGMVAWLAGGDPYAPNLATPVDLGDGRDPFTGVSTSSSTGAAVRAS